MRPHLIDAAYRWQQLPNFADIVAVMVSLGTVLAVSMVMWQAVFLLLRRPRQRFWRGLLWVIVLSSVVYTLLYMSGAQGILSVLTVPGEDVPLPSIMRTGALDILLLTVAYVLRGANPPGGTDAPG